MSNLIIYGKICEIKINEHNKQQVTVRIEKILSFCYDGLNLINDSKMFDLNNHKNFFENVYSYNIKGTISHHEVKYYLLYSALRQESASSKCRKYKCKF